MTSNLRIVIGPPGTGKTSFLARQLERAVEKHDPDKIMACSFTRGAVAELNRRDLPIPEDNVGTLHSIGYRALGCPDMVETQAGIKDFIATYPRFAPLFSDVRGTADMDDVNVSSPILAEFNYLRSTKLPLAMWPQTTRIVYEAWSAWKQERNGVDYADMISLPLERRLRPQNCPEIGFFDEAQDFSQAEAELVHFWGQDMDQYFLVGDSDQCHPPGVEISMTGGFSKKIEDVVVGEEVVSFFTCKSNFRGVSRQGRKILNVSKRPYAGELITIYGYTLIGTPCTPNHKWLTRFNEKAKEVWAVYLMAKGTKARIGCTKLLNSAGNMISRRAYQEKAEAAWIIKTFTNKQDAYDYEIILSVKYGIPQIRFLEPTGNLGSYQNGFITQDRINNIYKNIPNLPLKTVVCLTDHGRKIEYPFWTPASSAHQGQYTFICHACNMIDGIMSVKRFDGSVHGGEWERISISKSLYDGDVYSLEVEPTEGGRKLYVANGLVTHNSIFGFKGADPCLLDVSGHDHRVLAQSWRVPAAVHGLARQIISRNKNRQDHEYRPTEKKGEVQFLNYSLNDPHHIITLLHDLPGRVMVLASCSYMLSPVVAALKSAGIPFHNPFRRKRADWNPLYQSKKKGANVRLITRLNAFLANTESWRGWTPKEIQLWEPLTKGVFDKHSREILRQLPEDLPLTADQLTDIMGDDHTSAALFDDIDWLKNHLKKDSQTKCEYYFKILEDHKKGYTETPKIIVGTIHSVKGGESDHVVISPDLSWEAYRSAKWDEINRVFYVGLTRARESVHLLVPSLTPNRKQTVPHILWTH